MTIITAQAVSRQTSDFLRSSPGMVIGAETTVESRTGETFATRDPSTGEVLGRVPAARAADVDRAVRAAAQAFRSKSWSTLSPASRARLLTCLADRVEADARTLAELDSLDMGKPIRESLDSISGVVTALHYYAGWPTKIEGTVDAVRSPYWAYTDYEPLGVCGAILPWNFPLVMAVHKIGPALAAGNTMVVKPAEQSPLSALRLAQLALEAGIPPGVLNIVTGDGAGAGRPLVEHDMVAKIGFTGSTPVGREIAVAAARRGARTSLELGGKAPNIVFADADLDVAAASAAECVWENAGQVCMAPTRLLVERRVHDKVLERVIEIGTNLQIGVALDEQTEMGPLVSAEQRDRVQHYIDVAQSEGAERVLGDRNLPSTGHFVAPTVFAGVRNDMTIAQEEIFGPVLGVIPFDSEEEAVRLANDSPYDLAAAVWTRDIGRARRVSSAVHAGTVWVNTCGRLDPAQGFGGYHRSGQGRELGRTSVYGYLQAKGVFIGE